ncbi:histone-like nucleoid-structuring protein Lsr2 [Amycolatopsis sp. NPDC003865]
MAQRVLIHMTDDLDGSEGASTVRFGLDGVSYEIDLSEGNAADLRGAMQRFTDAARRTGGRRERGTGPAARSNGGTVKPGNGVPAAVFSSSEQTPATRSRAREIRAWAAEAGYELSPKGRIPREVVEAFDNREPDEPTEDEKPRRGGRRKRA